MKKLFLFISIFLYCITVQAAQIYQWKDAKGTWQFTEHPPLSGVPFQLKQLPDSVILNKPEENKTPQPEKIDKNEKPFISIEKLEKTDKPVVVPDARTEKVSPDKKPNEIKNISEEPKITVKKTLMKAQRQSRYVSDYAQLLLLEDRQKLQEILEQFERQHHIETVVFTCYTLGDYEGGAEGVESFSQKLFQDWQLKQGILIVISLLDKQLHIYASPQIDENNRTKIQNLREEILIPIFKEGPFSEGLSQAIQAIITIFKPQKKSELVEIKESPKEIKEKSTKEMPKMIEKKDYWLEIVLMLSLALWWAIIRLWRNRKGRCPQCSGKLIKYQLNQQFIGMRCSNCGTQLILAPAHSSRHWKHCPSCGNQSFYVKSWSWLINQLELTKECQVCGFKRQEKVKLSPAQNSVDGAA
jgi:uncharacterized membrane protein YgcG